MERRFLRLQFITWTGVQAFCLLALAAQAQEVRVAAAADLQFAMKDLAARFDKASGARVSVTYGSSGSFYSQLQSGAPFDIFFSADSDYPKRLESAGLTEMGTLCVYAIGRITLWMPPEAEANPASEHWKSLLDPAVKKIAIANPHHAPYGRAAVAALQNAGIYERVKTKLVYGENVSQAAQFVQSGNAQAGIVAMSLAVSSAMKNGKTWEIPANLYPPIEQVAIVMKSARNRETARLFLDFVKGPTGKEILAKAGFALPDSNAGAKETR